MMWTRHGINGRGRYPRQGGDIVHFGRKITALAEQPTRRPHDRLPRCRTGHHPAGTSRMGSDEAAPLDPELRAQGVEGLRVVDASAMPDLLSPPTSTPAC